MTNIFATTVENEFIFRSSLPVERKNNKFLGKVPKEYTDENNIIRAINVRIQQSMKVKSKKVGKNMRLKLKTIIKFPNKI